MRGAGMHDVTIRSGAVRLAASVYGHAEAPPVLFLHGLGNARDVWHDWACDLADRHRVLTLDFRGHGHSSVAARYALTDFLDDASAALQFLGRPARVVGHSLGGTVAGALAVQGHPLVARALLVDPAWRFGEPEEFARTVYPRRFAMLREMITQLHAAEAPLERWIARVASTPHPKGGHFADYLSPRQVASHASALQRQDPACWETSAEVMFGGLPLDTPFRVPTEVIHADPTLGAAVLEVHAERMAAENEPVAMHYYAGSDHFPHRTTPFAERFGRDLSAFLTA